MKKLFIIAMIAVAPVSAKDRCESVHSISETSMKLRQNNFPMPKLMAMAGDNESAKSIVSMAYEYPVWTTKETKLKAIKEFGNEMASKCYGGKLLD